MERTLRTIAIMLLAPPLLLYALAQAGAFSPSANLSAVASYALLAPAWAAGMAALPTSGWRRQVQLIVGLAYTLVAIPALPFLALLAVCTTGDCL
jgi:hypothetical protein